MSVREHWINVRVNPEELARIREKQKELGREAISRTAICIMVRLWGSAA